MADDVAYRSAVDRVLCHPDAATDCWTARLVEGVFSPWKAVWSLIRRFDTCRQRSGRPHSATLRHLRLAHLCPKENTAPDS